MTTTAAPDPSGGDGSKPFTGWSADLIAQSDAARASGRKASKRGKRKEFHTPPLSITSLTDAVTLLLVYLLKTFATNPVEVKDPSIELPRSTCNPAPGSSKGDLPPRDGCSEIDPATIVMVTGPQMTRSEGAAKVIIPVAPRIVVDGKAVVELDPKTYRIPDAAKDAASGGYVVTGLREALKEAREVKALTAQLTGKKFDGRVVILADRQTPYRVLTDVLVTCGESGFADFRFAVIKPD